MSAPLTHPAIRAYLTEVDVAAATLPTPRRRELVADLSEHLGTVLPADADESAVQQALEQLGSPREIAAAAIAEEPGATPLMPESRRRTALTLVAMALAAPLLPGGIGVLLMVLASVLIWRSSAWVRSDKLKGVAGALSPLLVLPLAAGAFAVLGNGLSAGELLGVVAIASVLPLVAAIHLRRRADRLLVPAA